MLSAGRSRARPELEDGNWMLELWSQNLTDRDYYQVAFDATYQPGGVNAFLGAPRTVGLTLRKRID